MTKIRAALGDDALGIAKVYAQLGSVFGRQGQFEAAKKPLEEAVRIFRLHAAYKPSQEVQKLFSVTLSDLGTNLKMEKKYGESIKVLLEGLEMMKRVDFDQKKVLFPRLVITIGSVYNSLAEYQKTIEHLEQLLMMLRADPDKSHDNMENTSLALGVLEDAYASAGMHDKASECDDKLRALGRDPELEWAPLMNEAKRLMEQFKLDEALSLLQQALTIARRLYGEKHPFTLDTLGHIAAIYANQGKEDESLKLNKKVLKYSRLALGSGDLKVVRSLFIVGSMLYNRGEFEKALPMLIEARDLYVASCGVDSIDVAHANLLLASCRTQAGDMREALAEAEESNRVFSKFGTSKHADEAQNAAFLVSEIKAVLRL